MMNMYERDIIDQVHNDDDTISKYISETSLICKTKARWRPSAIRI